MVIRPADLPTDRARILDFLRSRGGGLSENKHAFLTGDGRHGAGMIAEEEGNVVGYVGLAPTQREGEWAMELVSPMASPAGLVDEALRWAKAEGARRLRWWVYHPQHESLPIENGFHLERQLLVMGRPLPFRGAPSWEEFTVTSFRPGEDEQAWLEVNNAAFAGHPENGDQTIDDLRRRLAMEWFEPAGLRMAWEGRRPAGFCWTKVHPGEKGEIYIICVAPAYRGRGLGRALVEEGLHHLSARGCNSVFLYTEGGNQPAVDLYRSLGFDVLRIHRSFLRDLVG